MAAIFGALVVCYFSWRWHLHREIHGHLAYFKAAGYPTTPVELNTFYTAVPAGENAALLLTNAFAKLAVRDTNNPNLPLVGTAPMPGRTNTLTSARAAAVLACLVDNAEALRLLRVALVRPQCRYPIGLTNGWQTRLPHLAQIVSFGRLLELEALTAAEAPLAIQSITDLFRLEATLKNEPASISLIVRFRLRTIALRTMERLLSTHTLTDGQLASLEKLLPEVWQPADFSRAIAGEICMAREFYEIRPWQVFGYIASFGTEADWDPDAPLKPLDTLSGSLVEVLAFQSENYLLLIETQAALHRASQASTPERQPLVKAAMSQVPNVSKPRSRFQSVFWKRNKILAGMLLPSLAEIAPKDASSLAHLRAATLALAIERFRNAHAGALPQTLKNLVPDDLTKIPSDPSTGESLSFKRLNHGYAIFRLGSVVAEGEEQPKVDSEYLFIVER